MWLSAESLFAIKIENLHDQSWSDILKVQTKEENYFGIGGLSHIETLACTLKFSIMNMLA